MSLLPDSLVGAFVTMHVGAMILGLGAAAVADVLGLGILLGKARTPRRFLAGLHDGIIAALVVLVVSGCGLIILKSGGWCELDGTAVVRLGPVCLPSKIIAKLVLMAALIVVALLIDRFLLPLARRVERPLLPHLGVHETVRASFITTASFTCWCSLAAIPLVASLHSWPVMDLLARCVLIWLLLGTFASITLLAMRALLDTKALPSSAARPAAVRPPARSDLWSHASPAAPQSRANVISLFPAARAAAETPRRQPRGREEKAHQTLGDAVAACRQALLGTAGISLVVNVLMLAGPLYMLQVYDRVLTSRNVETLSVLTAVLVGIYAFMGLLDVIRGRVLARVALRFDRLIGPRLFAGFVGATSSKQGGASQQPMRDLEQVRQFISGPTPTAIFDLPWTPLYILLIFLLHPILGTVAIVGTLVLVALSVCTQIMTRQPLTRAADEVARTHALVDAGRRNSETLRAMAMVEKHRDRWLDEHRAALSRQLQAGDIAGSFSVATKVGRLLLQSLVLGTGAFLALSDAMSPGAMIAASIITTRALAPIEQLISQWRGLLTVWGALQRCRTTFEEIDADKPHLALPDPVGYLEVSKLYVTLSGRAEPVLKGINFALEPGDALAVIGPSAAGKSTLARALVAVLPARHGEIRLDGAALPQWDPAHLGKHVGYLPQDVTLFDGTIAENIARLDPSPDPQAVLAAAVAADAHEAILRLEQGYQTRVGDGGAALSGGQRQRIALARALYGNPALIVLDEPNANLDQAGEAALVTAISRARAANRTVIVMAHRQSVLVAVNRLLVLKEGRQVAFGETTEVLKKIRPPRRKEAQHAGIVATGGARRAP